MPDTPLSTAYPDLTTIADLTEANDDILQRKAGAWTNRTLAQVKSDLALNNVTNTSDANKPVSTAQQTALDLKAPLASPTFTGTPAAPTAAFGTNTTQVATTAFVQAATGNYTMEGGIFTAFAMVDGATYYIGYGEVTSPAIHTTMANTQMKVPRAGVITDVIFSTFINTNGSNEAVAHNMRVNSTDTLLSASETYDAGSNTPKVFTYHGLSIAVALDDLIAFKITCPTWATNPAFTSGHLLIFIR